MSAPRQGRDVCVLDTRFVVRPLSSMNVASGHLNLAATGCS